MRILLDLQGCQSASRLRGIGRYTLSLGQAIARNAGEHEVWLLLSDLFPDTVMPLRQQFAGLVPANRIVLFHAPGPVAEQRQENSARTRIAELIREHAIAELSPDVVHVGSLFEGFVDDAVTSVGCLVTGVPTAVTLYDLIPLRDPDRYLTNPLYCNYYLNKIESLKRADLLLSISKSAGAEAYSALGWSLTDAVVDIGSAADMRFRPLDLSADAAAEVSNRLGLERPFVMHVGAIEPRKNFEGLIRAFAALPPELRGCHQLLLIAQGDDVARDSLRRLAAAVGLAAKDVVILSYARDDDLVALYNLCRLFVFPSSHEGFGLPALEAMACGAAVIGSNASSIPEVIGRDDALFDPASNGAIAEAIHRALADDAFRGSLREHGKRQAKKFSWDATGRRALDAMIALRRRSECLRPVSMVAEARRPKLAFVSPLPPERTGIADYVTELLPALARHYDITLVNDLSGTTDPWIQENLSLRSVEWFRRHADSFDRVLYQFGNSPFHAHMFELLARHPGVVVLHDFFLSAVLNWMDESGYAPNAFAHALYYSHGYPALICLFNGGRELAKQTYPANWATLARAQAVIVHSRVSMELAKRWYGPNAADLFVGVLFPRVSPGELTREAARQLLGVPQTEFLFCSFGWIDPTKLSDRLLRAWAGSGLAEDRNCRLVFVGENHGGDYGSQLLSTIAIGCLQGRIIITGYTAPEIYRAYLQAADVAVQLRTMSRGETSAAIFDCLAHGLPLVVNAHGSAAEIPPDAVVFLEDEFSDEALRDALVMLRNDAGLRESLAEAGRRYVTEHHAPARVAEQYSYAIESCITMGAPAAYRRLVASIADMARSATLSERDLVDVAQSIARNRRQGSPKQLFLDVSEIALHDRRTGIERVARGIAIAMLRSPPGGVRVEPVYRCASGFRYARKLALSMLGLPNVAPPDEPIEASRGDIYLSLEWSPTGVSDSRWHLEQMRRRGVRICFVVYDILPLQFPQYFLDFIPPSCRQWVADICALADSLVCISKAVADDLRSWVEANPPDRAGVLEIGWFHLGADIEQTSPSIGTTRDEVAMLSVLRRDPTCLMVGTVEPRKGYEQAIQAFERLWAAGKGPNLVIVGKQGWMVEELAKRLRTHPEAGTRLFWLEAVSDELLGQLYGAASVLLAASKGEGFGLPLIEAARHGLPIIARDIPVFREVVGVHAFYFAGDSAEQLEAAISEWLALDAVGGAPQPRGLPFLTWEESAQQLYAAITGSAYARWAPPTLREHALQNHLWLIHQARRRLVRELLPQADAILDLGGANSPLHKMGYPHSFKRLTIIDLPTAARHEYCKEIDIDETSDKGEVVVRYEDMTSLSSFNSETIDLVWSGQSIEHVPPGSGERMCREAWRVLRPGGVFALDTPNRLIAELHAKRCGGGYIHPEDYIEYQPGQLRDMLEKVGFVLERELGICEMPETARTKEFDYLDFLYGAEISQNIGECYIQFYLCRKPTP